MSAGGSPPTHNPWAMAVTGDSHVGLVKGPDRRWPLGCLHVEAMIMIKRDANTFIAALMPGLQPLCGLFRQLVSIIEIIRTQPKVWILL